MKSLSLFVMLLILKGSIAEEVMSSSLKTDITVNARPGARNNKEMGLRTIPVVRGKNVQEGYFEGPGAYPANNTVLSTGFYSRYFSDSNCENPLMTYGAKWYTDSPSTDCITFYKDFPWAYSLKHFCSNTSLTVYQYYTGEGCAYGTESDWQERYATFENCFYDTDNKYYMGTAQCTSKSYADILTEIKEEGASQISIGYSNSTCSTTENVFPDYFTVNYISPCTPYSSSLSTIKSYMGGNCGGNLGDTKYFSDSNCQSLVAVNYFTLQGCHVVTDNAAAAQSNTCLLPATQAYKEITFPSAISYKYSTETKKNAYATLTLYDSSSKCSGNSFYITVVVNKCFYFSPLSKHVIFQFKNGVMSMFSSSSSTCSKKTSIGTHSLNTCSTIKGHKFKISSYMAPGKLTTPNNAALIGHIEQSKGGYISMIAYMSSLNKPLTDRTSTKGMTEYYKLSCKQGYPIKTNYTDISYKTKTSEYSLINGDANFVCLTSKTGYKTTSSSSSSSSSTVSKSSAPLPMASTPAFDVNIDVATPATAAKTSSSSHVSSQSSSSESESQYIDFAKEVIKVLDFRFKSINEYTKKLAHSAGSIHSKTKSTAHLKKTTTTKTKYFNH